MADKYEKSLDDELDWTKADQYHKAALQISDKCFEIKKLSIVTITAFITVLVKFTKDNLDWSLFISIYLIIIMFWFIDSVSYYYQAKLRQNILDHFNNITERNAPQNVTDEEKDKPKQENKFKKIKKSVFNHSMWVYYIMILFNTITSYLFWIGKIK